MISSPVYLYIHDVDPISSM
uniref:Uncharacterized protein n=1 Tax=Arundo donax TaxID=35708 RepID=A0A0A9AQ74_ARUDO